MMPRQAARARSSPTANDRYGALLVSSTAGGTRHARTVRESVARLTSRNATRLTQDRLAACRHTQLAGQHRAAARPGLADLAPDRVAGRALPRPGAVRVVLLEALPLPQRPAGAGRALPQ